MSLVLRISVAVAMTATFVSAQSSDVTPPSLLSFSFGPGAIDTRSGPQNLTFTADVSDDLSGVLIVRVDLTGPNNQGYPVYLSRTAGTELLGTYTRVFTFPQFTASGAWRINAISLEDVTRNSGLISNAILQQRSYPTSLNVTSTPDIVPARIESLQFTPSTVNVSAADATVTMRMRLTDSLAGVGIEETATACNCTYQLLTLSRPSGREQTKWVGNTKFQLVSGDRKDGIWEGAFTMPRHSEPGFWSASINLFDSAINFSGYTPASLAAAGLPSGITVISSSADTVMPSLTNLRLSSVTVDPSLSPQSLTITFGVQDALSGVDFLRDEVCPCRFIGVEMRSPSGNQLVHSISSAFPQVGGTARNGTWTGTVSFPRYAEAGTWSIHVHLKDKAQNLRVVTPAELRAAGLPSGVNVLRASYVTDGTVPSNGGAVVDEVFGSRAQITVPNGALPVATKISIDVLQNPPEIAAPQGFSAPVTRFVNFELDPHPTAPIGPPGYTVTIPLVNPMQPGTPLTLFRLDPISGNLVAARSVSAGFVPGAVDAGGLSATFTGVASFSTIVGLPGAVQKPGDLNSDGVINCADVSIVRAAFGKRSGQIGFDARADINRDGAVNVSDLSFVLRQLPAGSVCQ